MMHDYTIWPAVDDKERSAGASNLLALFVHLMLVPAIQTYKSVDFETAVKLWAKLLNDELRSDLTNDVETLVKESTQQMGVDAILKSRFNKALTEALANGVSGDERVAWLNSDNVTGIATTMDVGEDMYGVPVLDDWQRAYSEDTHRFEWYKPEDYGFVRVPIDAYKIQLGYADEQEYYGRLEQLAETLFDAYPVDTIDGTGFLVNGVYVTSSQMEQMIEERRGEWYEL